MEKRNNPKLDAMRERSLIVENERQSFDTPKFYLTEQEITDHDKTYDYKKDGENYFYKKKGETSWKKATGKGLTSIKTKVFGGSSEPTPQQKTKPTEKPTTTQNTDYDSILKDMMGTKTNRTDSNAGAGNIGDTTKIAKTQEKLYEIPFKNAEDGNKFRSWVNSNKEVLSKVNQSIKDQLGKSDGLSLEGGFNNDYIKVAWGVAGEDYTQQSDNSKDETSSGGFSFRDQLSKIAPNAVQWLMPDNLSNNSFRESHLIELYKAITNSMERTGNSDAGNTEYADWGPEYVEWFVNDKGLGAKEIITKSASDSKFQIATTIGRGNWVVDKNDPNKITYTDEYDWNKGGEGRVRYGQSSSVTDESLKDLNYAQKINKLMDVGLNAYQAIRELQHRDAPVTGTVDAPKITLTLDKSELGGETV